MLTVLVWLQVSDIERVKFKENPMNRLVLDNERSMSMINKLIDSKIQSMAPVKCQQQQTGYARKNVLIHLSGGAGTGKSAIAAAIAEHHQRPLIRMCLDDSSFFPRDMRTDLACTLELARDWQAIVVVDTVASVRELEKRRITHEFARGLERCDGIAIVLSRNDEGGLNEVARLCQINVRLETFNQKKRERIWQLLVDGYERDMPGSSLTSLLDQETIGKMSLWELNGHDIQHLFENILSLQEVSGGEPLKLEDMKELKNITQQVSEPLKDEPASEKS